MEQLALTTIIDQLPISTLRSGGDLGGASVSSPLRSGGDLGGAIVIDPRDIPLPSDLIDVWSDATSMWMMRYTCRGKLGKSFETIKVHARAWFDFFTYLLPSRPTLTGMEAQARAISAGDETAWIQLARQIREVITECYVQSRLDAYRGLKSGIKPPWEIDTTDVQRWELDLEQRTHITSKLVRGPRKSKKNPLGGNQRVEKPEKLSSESLAQRMASLSSCTWVRRTSSARPRTCSG